MNRVLAVLVIGVIFSPPAGAGDEPGVVVNLSKHRIWEAESVLFEVTVDNVENPPRPDMSAFKDFDVEFLGAQDHNSTQIYVINNRRTEIKRFGKTFRYRLTPKRTGGLSLPSPLVEVDGEVLKGRSLRLQVKPAGDQDLALLSIETDRTEVYLLQPFEITLKVWVKALPEPHSAKSPVNVQDSPPALRIPWVEPPDGLKAKKSFSDWLSPLINRRRGFNINDLVAQQDSLFTFFERIPARFDLESRRVERPGRKGEDEHYVEYTLRRVFTAVKTGDYTFGPVTLRGIFASVVSSRGLEGEEIYAVARSATVHVSDAPVEERPDTYTGAVGRFTFEAGLEPQRARVGDPVTLTLALIGEGTLDRSFAPDIAALPEVAGNFKVYEATEETEGRKRIFTYSIRPLHENVGEFPSVEIACFDVERDRFVTLRTDPIPLDVEAADRLEEGDIVSNGRQKPQNRVEALKDGIFANVMDLSGIRNQSVRPERWAGLMAGMLVFYIAAAAAVGRMRKKYGDPAAQRRRSAPARARSLLKEGAALLGRGEVGEGAERMRSGLTGFVGDVLALPGEGLTHKDLEEHAGRLGLSTESAKILGRLLEECDAVRYGVTPGGGARDPAEMGKDILHAFETAVRELRAAGRLK